MPRETTIMDSKLVFSGRYLQEWLKKVENWVQLIKAVQNSGNDRAYHKMFKILGQKLYNSALTIEKQ